MSFSHTKWWDPKIETKNVTEAFRKIVSLSKTKAIFPMSLPSKNRYYESIKLNLMSIAADPLENFTLSNKILELIDNFDLDLLFQYLFKRNPGSTIDFSSDIILKLCLFYNEVSLKEKCENGTGSHRR